jgi:hypothetical protein
MADTSFRGFLGRSLQVLEREAPLAYRAVCDTLGARRVAIRVDAERLLVENLSGKLCLVSAEGSVSAEASASRCVLRALIEGEVGLTDAILSDQVELVGGLDDLVAFHEALLFYFMGAVRSPSFVVLSDEFLATGAPSGLERKRRSARSMGAIE